MNIMVNPVTSTNIIVPSYHRRQIAIGIFRFRVNVDRNLLTNRNFVATDDRDANNLLKNNLLTGM